MIVMQSLFSLHSVYLCVWLHFQTTSSTDGCWNDRIHKTLRTNNPAESQVLSPKQVSSSHGTDSPRTGLVCDWNMEIIRGFAMFLPLEARMELPPASPGLRWGSCGLFKEMLNPKKARKHRLCDHSSISAPEASVPLIP